MPSFPGADEAKPRLGSVRKRSTAQRPEYPNMGAAEPDISNRVLGYIMLPLRTVLVFCQASITFFLLHSTWRFMGSYKCI